MPSSQTLAPSRDEPVPLGRRDSSGQIVPLKQPSTQSLNLDDGPSGLTFSDPPIPPTPAGAVTNEPSEVATPPTRVFQAKGSVNVDGEAQADLTNETVDTLALVRKSKSASRELKRGTTFDSASSDTRSS